MEEGGRRCKGRGLRYEKIDLMADLQRRERISLTSLRRANGYAKENSLKRLSGEQMKIALRYWLLSSEEQSFYCWLQCRMTIYILSGT